MRSPTEAPPLLQASATSSAAAGPAVRFRRSKTISLKAMAKQRRREAQPPAGRAICPACGETPLRRDNEKGVCGYCQANGIPDISVLAPMPKRPACRAECADIPRPCPFLSCRHHLYLDVNPATGSIKFNFPTLDPWEIEESCALDVADRGGTTLEEVGAIINVTRERIRQMEARALLRLQRATPRDQVG